MAIHDRAGKRPLQSSLTDVPRLTSEYYAGKPDAAVSEQRVSFGTSGHRGSSLALSFNENHILAIAQAICTHRAAQGIRGPLFLGMDTHALSEPAWITTLEVLAANDVDVMIQTGRGYTPTPAISHAILTYNQQHTEKADGIVVTPSHNPPDNGGIKYNPPNGGPADTTTTDWIANAANELLERDSAAVKRIPIERALTAATTHDHDYVNTYVADLTTVIDVDAIKSADLSIGADALGGSGFAYYEAIVDHFGLNLDIRNGAADPTFGFMCLDHDGKIRMDCSSPYAMASLIELKDTYDVAFGNDPDFDRHGIVCPSSGLMNPNHYLAVAIDYLFRSRKGWPARAAVGKTLVSSTMIDHVARSLGRGLYEVPVGFKWYVDGLLNADLGFGGEESAGASFLRTDGTVWSTDKDGIILSLLAAEITATTGADPGTYYKTLTDAFGEPVYERIDAAATPAQKARLKALSPEMIQATELAGHPITSKLTRAPGNDAPIGGLKVTTDKGWFAARPSGTENVYKIYAESFLGTDHLATLQFEAQEIVDSTISD